MTAIRNVIFDLGGVVLDWSPDKIAASLDYLEPARQQQFKNSWFAHPDWHLFDRGTISELELTGRIQARTGQSAGDISSILQLARESLVEKTATVQLMQRLHDRGVSLFCLSNMPASFYAHLRERHGFWDLFSGVVISSQIKMIKPEAAIFRYLLEKFQLPAAATVFIDDVAANIAGAEACGIKSILFVDAAQCEREFNQLVNGADSAPASCRPGV